MLYEAWKKIQLPSHTKEVVNSSVEKKVDSENHHGRRFYNQLFSSFGANVDLYEEAKVFSKKKVGVVDKYRLNLLRVWKREKGVQ